MKTKYIVSVENTFLTPINPMPDILFNEMVNMSTQTDNTNNNDRKSNSSMFSGQNYVCQMKSSTIGEMRFHAGHHKHSFSTYNRSIICKVIKGQMKVKCGLQKWTITENKDIRLNSNSTYFVKNNSLLNECIITFTFSTPTNN